MLVFEVFVLFSVLASVIIEDFCKGEFKRIRSVVFLFILNLLNWLMLTQPGVVPAFIVEVSF